MAGAVAGQTGQAAGREGLFEEVDAASNPAVIPRNHRVEEALEAAVEQGDYTVMERLLNVLSKPYAHTPEPDDYYTGPSESTRRYRTYCGT